MHKYEKLPVRSDSVSNRCPLNTGVSHQKETLGLLLTLFFFFFFFQSKEASVTFAELGGRFQNFISHPDPVYAV